jgi:hypothetical protein
MAGNACFMSGDYFFRMWYRHKFINCFDFTATTMDNRETNLNRIPMAAKKLVAYLSSTHTSTHRSS